ncbi:RNA polymerase sigma factor [Haliangium ochraceum]|uniref:RNA polymerase, sigma-24 subunit, ECF subfamily n=1 Tax=Haliangium ochraceum (strain DSM 14365 / JCM 11303 / SMP-2) TaxID=502025 RepID=D0LGE6_HALO1|nr:sigma-70 family RNA polymerase sigma factor [Haliangium ochraceum]ACY18171.1 RNA polymerase, sigma-24 subunit, ECF subfamily [Haliangium ochraceum DSM 14365]
MNAAKRRLNSKEEQDLHTQLALFWNDRTHEERNAYANVLVFLILNGGDVLAPAAFEVIVHDIIKHPTTPLPYCIEADEDFREAVAIAVMDKLRASGPVNGEGADDAAAQEQPWRRLVGYQCDNDIASGNFRAWLKVIAYRTAVDLLRRHPMSVGSRGGRRWLRSVPIDDWDAGGQAVEHWYTDTPLAVRLDVLRALVTTGAWLQDLAEEDREMLCMRVDADMGYREIADRFDSTPEAVRKRIKRLREKLRDELELSMLQRA